MTSSMRPPRVEQTRALLVIETFLFLVGLLGVVLSLQVAAGLELSDREDTALFSLIFTLAGAAAASSLGSRFVDRGHWPGWVLGLVAQLAALAAVVEALILRPFYAVPAILVLASAGWVTAALLHPEVRAHLLRRHRVRTSGH